MLPLEGGYLIEPERLLEKVLATQGEGVSFLGGEPLLQAELLAPLAKALQAAGRSVMIFSGYTLKALRRRRAPEIARLLAHCDLLVDGPFLQEQSPDTRRWIGSRNQRIHHLSRAYAPKDLKLKQPNTLELRLKGSELIINGWPAQGARTGFLGPQASEAQESLSAEELISLKLLDAILTGSFLPEERPQLQEHGLEFQRLASQRLQTACLRSLLQETEARNLLRQGRRVRLRPWERLPAPLQFYQATEALWRRWPRPEALRRRGRQQQIKEWLITGRGAGDWLVQLLLYRQLEQPWIYEFQDLVLPQLISINPLIALAEWHRRDFSLLLREGYVPLIELQERFWISRWSALLKRILKQETKSGWILAKREGLRSWLKALEEAGRLDLLYPLLSAVAGFTTETPLWKIQKLRRSLLMREHSERKALFSSREALLSALLELGQRAEELRGSRFGEEGYEAGQILWERSLPEGWQAKLEAIQRVLLGVLS